jgi:ATP-dependent Lhr-like helicase
MKPLMTVDGWFAEQGWRPLDFQRGAWVAYQDGASGLIHASTGTGKTYAVYLGAIQEAIRTGVESGRRKLEPLRLLWITPLRALSRDTAAALEAPIAPFGLNWDVGVRTGDTTSSQRSKQNKRLPTVLVTTPESLALFLTREDTREKFAGLHAVVIDEWHELMSTKRGVLVELALARLRSWRPSLRTWGLSATLGNINEALSTLLGVNRAGRVIRGSESKPIAIDSVIPPVLERFPWAGHLGLTLVPQVVAAVEEGKSALVFTNTRSQAELWYQALLQAQPNWAGTVAVHHGSLDRKVRDWVENQLHDGALRCVVSTSSLDLGVDFSPVDRVLQIGSPKGVARLLQRAGRSGHNPGRTSRITCVPTNAFELVEIAAARAAAQAGSIESRPPLVQPLDVLAQHAVTCALGGGFLPDELYREVRTTAAYANLTTREWEWVLDFITRGGDALKAYPDFRRVERLPDGRHVVADRRIAQRHRLSIGAIMADASVLVRFLGGKKLGTIEESFAAKLRAGDVFSFGGRQLQFVRLHEQTAWVKKSRGRPTTAPRWMGGRMPLSSELASAVREQLDAASCGQFASAEMKALRPILETQNRLSRTPGRRQLLVERLTSREGYHVFVFPFEGRLVHEGLAALLAYRLSRSQPLTMSLAVNDYGLELIGHASFELTASDLRRLLALERLEEDMLAAANTAELARRQFREVARVAGLVHHGLPHAGKSVRQLQASASLFYNVFVEHDPQNLLLRQAQREVLERQFEEPRMKQSIARMMEAEIIEVELKRPSPLSFPLLVERLRESLSSEKLADRVRRMAADLARNSIT